MPPTSLLPIGILAGALLAAGCASSSSGTSTSPYNNLNPSILPPGVSVSSQAAVTRNLQALPGWQICIGTCANAAVPTSYSSSQNVTSTSLNNDGTAASYSESGTPYGDVMWYYHLGNSQATHFVADLYIRIDQPANVEAIEIAVLENDGLNWYKMSTQCNYQTGEFRGFNVQTFQWQDLGASCVRAQASTWQRITLQFSLSGGATNFDGVSFDGVTQPITATLPPEPQTAASQLLGVHIQLDNSNTTSGYTLYADDWSLYSW